VSWSEDDIHRWLFSLASAPGRPGVRGSDAAVLGRLRAKPVVCVDQTIEGVHYDSGADPRLVGRKAAARALSDLAATAALPRAILVALSAPRSTSSKWIRSALAGARSMAREHGADLVGGDLACAGDRVRISVAAFGESTGKRAPPARDRVRPGQSIVLTGPVGGSILGRHLRFQLRFETGRALHALGATGMMDVSDGFAWDLLRLARTSGVRIDLDLARVPVHADARRIARKDGKDPLWHALHDGEDHELIASMPARAAARAAKRLRGLAIVGRASAGSGLFLRDTSGRTRPWRRSEGGYEHGL
jgi:thiamine-monophosphate kinase